MPNTTIELRSSGSTGNTPSLGVLANGELAINRADGILYYKTASNTLGSIRTTQPAGLTTEIQFNDAGSFGSNTGLTFNKTTGVFSAPIVASSNNGNGTNFRVGDDAWIGDVNLADTLRISGQQNVNNAYIVFGATNANTLGRAGSGPLTYTGDFRATGLVSGNELSSTQSSGNEGGQVNLAIPASGTTLVGSVTIDVFQNQLRFFQGDSAKGAYIDLTAAASGVGSNLLNPASTPDTLARETANAAFARANSANVLAQSAFDKANSVTQQGFVTITANGTNVVADANNDTLTLSAANGIGITANATTDAITINLNPTGVTSGTYGSNTIVPVFVVDAQGRLTSVTNTSFRTASTTQSGIVQLNDSITSTSTTLAATANSVTNAYVAAAGDALAFAIALG